MLEAWCRDLLALPESVWPAYALSREPLRGRLTLSSYRPYFDKAVSCGREQAGRLREAFGPLPCRDLADRMGLTVSDLPMPEGAGLVTFACFCEPDRIEVYGDNARAARSLLRSAGLSERLGDVDIAEMLLAHELFHAVQLRTPGLYVEQKHIRLWKLGPVENRSRLVSLEEVAAMAFAQRLLDMPVWPSLYDVWMLLPGAPEQARTLYQTLMRLGEEVADGNDPVC